MDPHGHHGQHGQHRQQGQRCRWILGFLGWHLDCLRKVSGKSWLLIDVGCPYLYKNVHTQDPGPSFLSLVWVICMVAGHPTMILALVLEIRSRDSGGVPGRVARSICPFPFPLSPCGVAPVLHRRRMEPRLVVWQIGDTNMQKAGRDGDSKTATTVLVTCTEITEQISDFCNFSVMIIQYYNIIYIVL